MRCIARSSKMLRNMAHKVTVMEKYMKNLSDLILKKMEEENYTIAKFADICDVSERQISDIKNRRVKNIELKTLVKICESHGISYVDVFGCKADLENQKRILSSFVLTNGNDNYVLLMQGH